MSEILDFADSCDIPLRYRPPQVYMELEPNQVYTDVYFVVEHQPDQCDQLPKSGSVKFSDIAIELGGKPSKPKWQVVKGTDDMCNATATAAGSQVELTWQAGG